MSVTLRGASSSASVSRTKRSQDQSEKPARLALGSRLKQRRHRHNPPHELLIASPWDLSRLNATRDLVSKSIHSNSSSISPFRKSDARELIWLSSAIALRICVDATSPPTYCSGWGTSLPHVWDLRSCGRTSKALKDGGQYAKAVFSRSAWTVRRLPRTARKDSHWRSIARAPGSQGCNRRCRRR